MVTGLLIRDAGLFDRLIRERKRKGIDLYDEVWDGMYVMPSMPGNAHQKLLDDLGDILTEVVKRGKMGDKYQGANVSDRRKGWDYNYRVPDHGRGAEEQPGDRLRHPLLRRPWVAVRGAG